jgi:GTP-binding protein Era
VSEQDQLPAGHRSGFVAVVGRPNVGKSTLINAYLGQKIAIVSSKPQTTRNRLLGILTRDDAQVVFVDTPGIHTPQHLLGKVMVEAARRSIPDADVILFLVDGSQAPGGEDVLVANAIGEHAHQAPVVLALNKMDLWSGAEPPYLDQYTQLLPVAARLPLSASRGDNCSELLQLIVSYLPLGPRYFPAEQVTDQHTRFIVAELVREAALTRLHQEVPYALAVMTEEFKERSQDMTYISVTVFVERESQKGIVIGQGGRTLKEIGQAARAEIERLVGTRVYLELHVKVRPKWRQDEEELRRLGYSVPKL